jgi:hypothetical protein
MTLCSDERSWALETFGRVALGHKSRKARLVEIASNLAMAPAGTVTSVFPDSASREGAFRWLSNENVPSRNVIGGMGASTLAQCKGLVYVPVDGTSLALRDRLHARDLGGVGTWTEGGRGLQALTSLAVDQNGASVGVLDVEWWVRRKSPDDSRRRRPHRSLASETGHTIDLLTRIDEARALHAPGARLWYQLDRGFDAWAVLRLARDRGLLMTVRSSYDRRVRSSGKRQRYLRQAVRRGRHLGWKEVDVPRCKERPARRARLRVRVAHVSIVLQVGRKRVEYADMAAVLAEEVDCRGHDRIHWLLLTTATVENLDDARGVIDGYTTRWRIEELHRTWKRGWCNVERTQLRRRESLYKWATLHLAVAARALRLTQLARKDPQRPAADEFTDDEIDAAIILKKKRTRFKRGDRPTLGDVVAMIAELGGYTGKSSGGPPGATVIGRGLERIASLAEGLRLMREK